MTALTTTLDPAAGVVGAAVGAAVAPDRPGAGGPLRIDYRLLSGVPGDASGSVLKDYVDCGFPVVTPLAQLADPDRYRMNAAAQVVRTGITILDAPAHRTLQTAIVALRGAKNAVADAFADFLERKLWEYDAYARGIPSGWVYASSATPHLTTIGRSYIGLNTRVAR